MESFDVINEMGKSLGYEKDRRLIHRDGDWHKGVHIWIVNCKGILLQKRSPNKDSFPNHFDVSCGAHVIAGETYEDAAVRELEEELGIIVSKENLGFIEERKHLTTDPARNFNNREILRVFILNEDIDLAGIMLQKSEVSEAKYFSIKEIRQHMQTKSLQFTPNISSDIITRLEKFTKLPVADVA